MIKKTSSYKAKKTTILGTSLIFIIAVVPVIYLVKFKNINDDIIAWGAASWIIAVLLKTTVYQIVIRRIVHKKLSLGWVSFINGLNSGFFELGAALAFFYFLDLRTFLEVVAFGVGVGSVEAIIIAFSGDLLKGTELESGSQKVQKKIREKSKNSWVNYEILFPPVERAAASVIHVATRGLVYIFYMNQSVLALLIALLSFILADGVIGYRLIYSGKIARFKTLVGFYIFFILLSVFNLLVFFMLWSVT